MNQIVKPKNVKRHSNVISHCTQVPGSFSKPKSPDSEYYNNPDDYPLQCQRRTVDVSGVYLGREDYVSRGVGWTPGSMSTHHPGWEVGVGPPASSLLPMSKVPTHRSRVWSGYSFDSTKYLRRLTVGRSLTNYGLSYVFQFRLQRVGTKSQPKITNKKHRPTL